MKDKRRTLLVVEPWAATLIAVDNQTGGMIPQLARAHLVGMVDLRCSTRAAISALSARNSSICCCQAIGSRWPTRGLMIAGVPLSARPRNAIVHGRDPTACFPSRRLPVNRFAGEPGRNRLVKHFIAGLGSVGRPGLRG
jgi:hypothetical protein